MKKIRIISELGDDEALLAVAEALRGTYMREVEIEVSPSLIGEEFFDIKRGQYDAWKIVQYYREVFRDDDYVLLVTDKDLYAAGLNFVFGLAWRGVAVISGHRLRQEFYEYPADRKLFLERIVKEAVHEIGHLHGLTHCGDRGCVMAFSNSILDTDRKDWKLCKKCLAKLRLGGILR
ncbi:MAG: archaemetzincin family Zn-dependent metalloprotease [Nitrososphaeria archaeon]|nr:archaemetzincin family Zn-dependent metalloprotease [Aigarchaeota archaeon]MCX8187371.1 archaemetzincin family Zn-dependent metalloprotease [Nitrososphaeria archaeon]MDW8021672.1 archaemetzincin family Zn-dependent metalloprotease [Nitrososphaerota archaeon]